VTTYEGRLELTWTNKDLRLLAHEDGSYEWVSPADYRVAEVRLLHDVTTVGTVGKVRAADNLLIRGDALNGGVPGGEHRVLVGCDQPFRPRQIVMQELKLWETGADLVKVRLIGI